MADPIAIWRADHARFARLLDLVERELAAFHGGGHPDYVLLLDVVHYLRHYPDRFHHPREDVAFTRLVERDPSMALPVARLLQEHRVIAAAGDRLLALVQGVVRTRWWSDRRSRPPRPPIFCTTGTTSRPRTTTSFRAPASC
jgi:hemerythrin-like domain-containing protein